MEIEDTENNTKTKESVIPIDNESFFEGRVFGEVKSSASVHLEDGLMTAKIETPEEIYHIEPSWRHFSTKKSMIAYKESDVIEPDPHLPTLPKTCGYVKEENDLEEEDDHDQNDLKNRTKRQTTGELFLDLRQTRCPLLLGKNLHVFLKKARQNSNYSKNLTRIFLLVADYRFYNEMGGGSSKTTVNYLISLIDRVHKIYEDTIWRDSPNGQGFSGKYL